MKKLISNGWNILEIAYLSCWGMISAHMGKVLSTQIANPPADPAVILFTVHQAAFILFYGGLGATVIKAVDSPLQRMLSEWAGQPPKLNVQAPSALTDPPKKDLTVQPSADKPVEIAVNQPKAP